MRYVSAQSRHDSGVCTCLDESGLCLSILVYLLGLIFVFSSSLVSFFYFSMLLLLFFRSLVRLASLSSLFFQSGTSPWHELCYSAVVWRRSAWSRSSRFGRAALFCVAWVCAAASVIRSCSMGGLALPYPRPSPLHVRGVQERFISQSLTLILVGRKGW